MAQIAFNGAIKIDEVTGSDELGDSDFESSERGSEDRENCEESKILSVLKRKKQKLYNGVWFDNIKTYSKINN